MNNSIKALDFGLQIRLSPSQKNVCDLSDQVSVMLRLNKLLLVGIGVITASFLGFQADALAAIMVGKNTGYIDLGGSADYYKKQAGTGTQTRLEMMFYVKEVDGKFMLDTSQTNTISFKQTSTNQTSSSVNPMDFDGWQTKAVPMSMMFDPSNNISSISFNTTDFELLSQYTQAGGKYNGDFLFVKGNPLFQGEYRQKLFTGMINISDPTKSSIGLTYTQIDVKAGKPILDPMGNPMDKRDWASKYTISTIGTYIMSANPEPMPNPVDNPKPGTPALGVIAIPESTSTLSLLALGTLGAASMLKRTLKQESTEKETAKVG